MGGRWTSSRKGGDHGWEQASGGNTMLALQGASLLQLSFPGPSVVIKIMVRKHISFPENL